VVPASGPELTAAALRDFLAVHMDGPPPPLAFVRLSELPLDASGRLDNAALPHPAHDPMTATERDLAGFIAELLQIDRIGPDEIFFRLGGPSFPGPELMRRIRDRFCVELAARDLFDTQTVARLADEIERRTGVTASR